MLTYPQIDPVLVSLGPLKVHWYGLMYLIAFALAWWILLIQVRRPWWRVTSEQVSDIVFYGAFGVVLGGRLGYVLFYNLPAYMADPLALFQIWNGGMSFHGGFIGVLVAIALYARKHRLGFFELTDLIAPAVPLGLFVGRLGNFINGELWGKVTNVPWAMVFPTGGPAPRHPSQLYEACLEGLMLFIILWWFAAKPRPRMAASALFLLGYGSFRFLVEFVREPDTHIGYLAWDWLTMGHLLSFPMIVVGLGFLWFAYQNSQNSAQE